MDLAHDKGHVEVDNSPMPSRLSSAIASLPRAYPGPGGAVAVL